MKIKILTGLAASALLLASCDINDVENITEQSTANFPVTSDDATAVLAGIYENLNAVNANPQESFLYYAQLASDDCYGGGGTNDKLMQAMDLITNYNANMTNDFWVQRYQGIARANTLIAAIPNTKLTDDEKKIADGEALFLRAFYHYELASMYGNVPCMTEPTGETVKPGEYKNLWGQILQDLYTASQELPDVRRTDGHVDKYAAEAMLGRAWLFATGMFCNGFELNDMISTNYSPLESWELPNGAVLTKAQVSACIDDIVNSGKFSLVGDFRNLWAYTNKYTVEDVDYTKGQNLKWVEDDNGTNPESMFAIKFNKLADWSTTIGYANGYALHFGVRGGQNYANTFPFGQGWGAGPVATNLYNDWVSADKDNKDKRKDATIQVVSELPGYTYGGWADFVQETDYYAKKWSPVSAKDASQSSGYTPCFENLMYGTDGWTQGANNMQLNNIHDLVLIRYADVLLMQSELESNTNGINLVRERAGLDKIDNYSLAALQNERRWELACEGIRWNDIRRWHIAAAALEKQTNQKCYYCGTETRNTAHNGGYTSRYNATAGFQKMPENQVSLGSVEQNPGWSDATSEYTGW